MNTPFSVTLRISPDAVLSEMKDIFTFSFEEFDIRDGRSKCAALRLLEPDYLDGFHIRLDIFALDKENMDSL